MRERESKTLEVIEATPLDGLLKKPSNLSSSRANKAIRQSAKLMLGVLDYVMRQGKPRLDIPDYFEGEGYKPGPEHNDEGNF